MTISAEQLEQWTNVARRDDWHRTLVGSDIRGMLGEIERLRSDIDRLTGWRPIETAPPPEDEMFIYYEPRGDKRCIGLAYHTKGGGWRDSEGNWSYRLNPTHWMPLPSAPKP